MLVSAPSATALAGLVRAERSVEASAAAFSRSFAPVSEPAPSRLGASDPLDGAAGDVVGPMIQLIAAQRAFTASLAVLRADEEMQRAFIERLR